MTVTSLLFSGFEIHGFDALGEEICGKLGWLDFPVGQVAEHVAARVIRVSLDHWIVFTSDSTVMSDRLRLSDECLNAAALTDTLDRWSFLSLSGDLASRRLGRFYSVSAYHRNRAVVSTQVNGVRVHCIQESMDTFTMLVPKSFDPAIRSALERTGVE